MRLYPKSWGICLALIITSGLAEAEEAKIADHPFFSPMLKGTWTESGQMAVAGKAVEGKSVSKSQSILGGFWIQQDGDAEFGTAKWTWRWMFRLRQTEAGKEIVQARYLDSKGQTTDYIGEWNEAKTSLRFLKPINETTRSLIQVTNDKTGRRLIEVGTVDQAGKVTLQYKALGVMDSDSEKESSGR